MFSAKIVKSIRVLIRHHADADNRYFFLVSVWAKNKQQDRQSKHILNTLTQKQWKNKRWNHVLKTNQMRAYIKFCIIFFVCNGKIQLSTVKNMTNIEREKERILNGNRRHSENLSEVSFSRNHIINVKRRT